MIIIDLNCEQGHRFEGWFASAAAFDAQCERGLVSCPVCGSHKVRRVPSVVHLASSPAGEADCTSAPVAPEEDRRRKMAAAYRAAVGEALRGSEDVGARFSEEARRIHYRETAARSIHGQATTREVEELREEGIDVLSLVAYRSEEELN